MKLSPHNIIHHELIGIDTKVVDSTNSSLVGIEGRIVDETKNILTVETDAQEKKIPKSCSSFIFTIPSFNGKRYLPLKIKVDGRLLLSQPENRIQTKFKKKFRK
ncbi:ribonuclease P protein component 1 [Candidatus Methanoperedens nitratireducens]|uniref:Ribonuclease P protein component 1 n=1 Tax=Candidatus Methanoperedens nitratireducens TaxID=1392998 RepID=A0A284VN79_9EURY|nr:ribonuclease P protein component 1 [Candidatus Methanoperedens nitroreducens]SNQ60702.1 Ribonuclease P protein component 1 [Candidatus Methanoperedens nitroreducens]